MKSVPNVAYRVDLTERAVQDVRQIHETIHAENVAQARTWFNGLEKAILSLGQYPARGAITAEDRHVRQLLYGRRRHIYRILYTIDEPTRVVTVLHIRYGGRDAFVLG